MNRAVQYWKSFVMAALVLAASLPAAAQAGGHSIMGGQLQAATPPSTLLSQIGIDQNLDAQVPLDLTFKDETGRDVRLGDYFGGKPVVMNFTYFSCPMMCPEVLSGMASAFTILKFDAGKDFTVLSVSFDPHDTPKEAAAEQAMYVKRYGRPGAEQGWHFLTGEPAAIAALTKAAGFRYAWDDRSQQYAHASGIMVLTPQGRIAQYFYGVEFSPKDLRFGLIQASQNKLGTLVDQVLLYCYHYDPRTGKYGAIISRVMQVAGAITILVLGGFLFMMFRMEPAWRGDKGGKA